MGAAMLLGVSIPFKEGSPAKIILNTTNILLKERKRKRVVHVPHQAPASITGSTITGFEMDEQSHLSTPASGHHTPGASSVICAALEARIEQLLEENTLLAQELRDLHHQNAERKERKKQKKERKSKEKKAKLRTDVWREILRLITAVLTPLPDGSPGRLVVMAIEALWLRERVPVPA
ncbi:hypothetical protein M436DRAFT_61684 [Aureobasidium namibiae CBS 147.97]|uniref:BZIP domain-containing protein n=1 Tax=Aureobasidium namibiae CBS 147.97 TaxID=1043004 RepID=A0A074WQ24_9PEZI